MDLVIFDLDGTLVDSKLDLAHSVNAARAALGLPAIENDRVYSYVGNGAPVLMRRAMGPDASEADVARALELFLAYYREHKLDNTVTYPGVPEALEILQRGGIQMAVLTNKPVNASRGIVEGLGLGRYFARVYGGNSFPEKKPHPLGVDTLLAELGIERDRTLMVGDSGVDVRTARNARIKVCGVRYGFQPESFEDDPPDMMVGRLDELAQALVTERQMRGATKS